MRKRGFAFLLAAAIAVCAVGCKGSTETDTSLGDVADAAASGTLLTDATDEESTENEGVTQEEDPAEERSQESELTDNEATENHTDQDEDAADETDTAQQDGTDGTQTAEAEETAEEQDSGANESAADTQGAQRESTVDTGNTASSGAVSGYESAAESKTTSASATVPATSTQAETVHIHTYDGGRVTTAATCHSEGTKTYTCTTCGATKTESIAKTEHTWVAATCTTPKTCSVCGATSGSALGHSYDSGKVTTAATCLSEGVKTYTCTACGATKTESIAKTEHTWTEATCTTPKTCSVCGATSGSALGHSYSDEGECIRCGALDPLGAKAMYQKSQEALAILNQYRAEAGLEALVWSDALYEAAQLRADEITGYFSHTRPDGSSCFTALTACGISYRTCGENIAAGYTSAQGVMNGWYNSDGHRANMLSESYTYAAIACVYSASSAYGYYWVTVFIG